MILKEHPSHDYVEMNASDLLPFGRNVVTQMTNNIGTFAPLDDPLINVSDALDDLVLKQKAFIANPKLGAAMRTSMKAVVRALNKQNKTVDKVADGDGGIIDKSGFHKTKAFSSPLVKPEKAMIVDHHPVGKGHYYTQCKAQAGNNFIVIICPIGTVITKNGNILMFSKAPIALYSDMHPTADMTNLPSGDQQLYVLTSNRSGMSDLSAPITISVP